MAETPPAQRFSLPGGEKGLNRQQCRQGWREWVDFQWLDFSAFLKTCLHSLKQSSFPWLSRLLLKTRGFELIGWRWEQYTTGKKQKKEEDPQPGGAITQTPHYNFWICITTQHANAVPSYGCDNVFQIPLQGLHAERTLGLLSELWPGLCLHSPVSEGGK